MRKFIFRCLPDVWLAIAVGLVVAAFMINPVWDLTGNHPHEVAAAIIAGIGAVMALLIGEVGWYCFLASLPPDERRAAKNARPFILKALGL